MQMKAAGREAEAVGPGSAPARRISGQTGGFRLRRDGTRRHDVVPGRRRHAPPPIVRPSRQLGSREDRQVAPAGRSRDGRRCRVRQLRRDWSGYGHPGQGAPLPGPSSAPTPRRSGQDGPPGMAAAGRSRYGAGPARVSRPRPCSRPARYPDASAMACRSWRFSRRSQHRLRRPSRPATSQPPRHGAWHRSAARPRPPRRPWPRRPPHR
jgi:hypothetical protein